MDIIINMKEFIIILLMMIIVFLLVVGSNGCEGPNKLTDAQVKTVSDNCKASDLRFSVYNDLTRSEAKWVKK